MPRYEFKLGGDEARKHWANIPESLRQLVNQRIEELLEDPINIPHREYDPHLGVHTIPIGEDKGLIVYAVVESARMVIFYRFTPGLD
jgi:hypothetical protein